MDAAAVGMARESREGVTGGEEVVPSDLPWTCPCMPLLQVELGLDALRVTHHSVCALELSVGRKGKRRLLALPESAAGAGRSERQVSGSRVLAVN